MKLPNLLTKYGFPPLCIAVVAYSSVACAAERDSLALDRAAHASVHNGMIIAHPPAHLHNGLTADGVLELDVYPGPNCVGDLALTGEQQPNPQTPDDLRQHYSCAYFGGNLVVGIDPAMGRTPPWWTMIRVTVRNWPTPHRPLPKGQLYNEATHTLIATMPVSDAAATQGIAVTQYVMIQP